MAVVFDTVVTVTGLAVTTLTTGAFTITSSANRAAVLGLSQKLNTSTAFTGSVGGVSGALIASTDNAVADRSLMFGVTNPPTGSQTATMSWTTAHDSALGVTTYSGVDQATSFNNGTNGSGTGVTTTIAITSTNGDLTVDNTHASASLSAPTQTSRYNSTWTNAHAYAGSTGPGTGTTTHQWTQSVSDTWNTSGANVKAAAGGGGGGPTEAGPTLWAGGMW